MAEWVASFLKGFLFVRTAAPAEYGAAVTLSIRRAAALPAIPPELQTFAINHGVCHTDGARFFLAVEESLVVIAEPTARRVEVWFGESPHAREPVALVNVFSYGMQAALRRAGVFDLHAGGVLDPVTGAGALFVGSPGSGKSTLTVKLAAHGWRYLSDDMVVLLETPAGLEIEGLRRLFAVSAPTLAGHDLPRLDEALGTPVASDPSKRKLQPDIVFPEGRVHRCRPRALFFPQVTGAAETRINPISARDAMQQLVRFCPWATYDPHAAPAYLGMLGRLANQCRAYELRAGRDLLAEPARAAQLLAPYMKE
ncbi:MAG TPA: hypothetical protein VF525_09795 [Pyrinomonadaceae bacterium]